MKARTRLLGVDYGTVRIGLAVSDPERRIVPGPIGMFQHGAGASEHQGIYVEVDPNDDRLITVR